MNRPKSRQPLGQSQSNTSTHAGNDSSRQRPSTSVTNARYSTGSGICRPQILQIVLNELKKQSQKLSKIKKECLSIRQQVTEIKQKLETKERSDF